MTRAAVKPTLAHSWTLENWPSDVFPNDTERARYVVRMHKAELLAAGAIARVGRQLVFFGANYQRWMETKRADVPNFKIAPNRQAAA
jgi:hypothetical protein